jgi:hypothetical protein
MTQQKESVVTVERFNAGLTWDEYFGGIHRNKEKFEYNYNETTISDEDAAAFRALVARDGGPFKLLVLGEDWCPDVFRGLPVLTRIAEASGMDLRIFPRDDNMDIMNEYLNKGQFQSIPTAVFFTRDHRYICHWSERPEKANREIPDMMKLFEGKEKPEARALYEEFQKGPVWASWREETVREIRALLEEKCA